MSINSILYHSKYSSELVRLSLIESHCLPLLLYGLECLNLKISQLKLIGSWWNSVYRKLFGYHKWESVKEVIFGLHRLDFLHLSTMRHVYFLKQLCHNNVISSIIRQSFCISEFFSFEQLSNIKMDWSDAKIKAMTFVSFKAKCGFQ